MKFFDSYFYSERIQLLSKAIPAIATHIVRLNDHTEIATYYEILKGLNRAVAVSIQDMQKCIINGGNRNETGNYQR